MASFGMKTSCLLFWQSEIELKFQIGSEPSSEGSNMVSEYLVSWQFISEQHNYLNAPFPEVCRVDCHSNQSPRAPHLSDHSLV
jgi:hypothetical protein